ncbi:sensor histidine kinase [Bradyrhizobium sp.]|jgi:K+-sensing histidine kinase KdpD|uniref:sensor histidine kinase n=1 Tax=Bradyrhizobium sp. TaxID=376 RepID=UPI003C15AB86
MGEARFTSSVALDPRELPHASARPWRRLILGGGLPLAMSLALVGAATIGLLLIGRFFPANLATIVYLIPVMVAASWWGTWPAIVAAIASAAAADFFFFPPYYSFRLDDTQAAVDLSLFLLVALVSGDLASRLRHEKEALRRREDELQYLYGFSRRLAACHTVTDLVEAIQGYLTETFGRHAAFFIPASTAASRPAIGDTVPAIIRNSVAAMMKPGEAPSRIVRDEEKNNIWLLRTVTSADTPRGVIAVDIGGAQSAAIDKQTRCIESILGEASQTLQRLDIGGAMEEASHRLKDQLLRDAFHGNLSHELRSPLAAIKGSASVLESMPSVRDENQALPLVSTITDEAERLDSFIGNLLHATRVSASDIRPHLSCADPRDVVNAAVRQRSRQLAAHRVNVDFDDDLPMIEVDSALVEEACGQLLENAAKYSPPGSTISVTVRSGTACVTVSIADQGAGITAEERAQLGRRSFRGERHRETVPGAGLGFWIASTFINFNNGWIDIESGGIGRGTTVSIILPEAVIDEDDVGSNDE